MESKLESRCKPEQNNIDLHKEISKGERKRKEKLSKLKKEVRKQMLNIKDDIDLDMSDDFELNKDNVENLIDKVQSEIEILTMREEDKIADNMEEIQSKLTEMKKIYSFLDMLESSRNVAYSFNSESSGQIILPF